MIDYETDTDSSASAAEAWKETPAAKPTIPDEIREAHEARREAAAPFENNRAREKARIQLENLTWVDIEGREIPVNWTVFAESYYEVLTESAGLNDDDDSPVSHGSAASLYIFMWLALHDFDTCYRRDPAYGVALKDNKTLWLRQIFEWAEKEFPMGESHLIRQTEAGAIKAALLRLSHYGRADVMEPLEPESGEDAPGNLPAPHG